RICSFADVQMPFMLAAPREYEMATRQAMNLAANDTSLPGDIPARRPIAIGKVYLVGAGPGAVDLLTLRAARLIESADIVLHDALVGPEILALACRAERVDVGKRCGAASTSQAFINARLVEAARRHRRVVRLKGGDPMLFGRAQEEIDALICANIEFEVVPGVTAALAASAQTGCPLTVRGLGRSVTFLTARLGSGEAPSEWWRAALAADTAAIYMAGGQLPELARELIEAGIPASRPAAVVENASMPQAAWQRFSLGALRDRGFRKGEGPALLLVGEVLAQCGAASGPLRGHVSSPEHVPLPEHVPIPEHVPLPEHASLLEHVLLPAQPRAVAGARG
ncbi:MAG: uroporphyrinogen-III C-methyltransferase, partial [Gammaproteobacteria bacterium]